MMIMKNCVFWVGLTLSRPQWQILATGIYIYCNFPINLLKISCNLTYIIILVRSSSKVCFVKITFRVLFYTHEVSSIKVFRQIPKRRLWSKKVFFVKEGVFRQKKCFAFKKKCERSEIHHC